jgi:hypothetical protein
MHKEEKAEAEDGAGTPWVELDAHRNAVFDESRPPEPSYVFVGRSFPSGTSLGMPCRHGPEKNLAE